MCLIDMQFQNLFHFNRTDLYSLAGGLYFSPPTKTFAPLRKSTEKCSSVLLRTESSGQQLRNHTAIRLENKSELSTPHNYKCASLRGFIFRSTFVLNKISFLLWECHFHGRDKATYGSTWAGARWYKLSLTRKAICFQEKCKTFLNEALGIVLASSSRSARACACSPFQKTPGCCSSSAHHCCFKPLWGFAEGKSKQKLAACFCCPAGREQTWMWESSPLSS